jgi:hypothetical protein
MQTKNIINNTSNRTHVLYFYAIKIYIKKHILWQEKYQEKNVDKMVLIIFFFLPSFEIAKIYLITFRFLLNKKHKKSNIFLKKKRKEGIIITNHLVAMKFKLVFFKNIFI